MGRTCHLLKLGMAYGSWPWSHADHGGSACRGEPPCFRSGQEDLFAKRSTVSQDIPNHKPGGKGLRIRGGFPKERSSHSSTRLVSFRIRRSPSLPRVLRLRPIFLTPDKLTSAVTHGPVY